MKKIIFMQVLSGFLILTQAHASIEAAKVNDKVITLEDVNARLAEAARANPLMVPTRKQVLDELIKREAAIQEAKKLKLDQDPVVNDRINNVLFYAAIEKKLGVELEKITLSDAEAKNWYEKYPEIRTSHIFIALPPYASNEDEQKASKKLSEILSEVKSGKVSFAEAAQKNSEDPSSAIGGDLDYRMKDRLDPSFYRAALKLGKAGDITGPIKTPFGLHLVRLTGKHTWNETDRVRVKRIIVEDKRQEIVNRYLNDLRQKSNVSVNEKVVKD
jgi:peptidyl-prolyl cis-trans isomerase C/peptidyl-prolyl cis-trans isomerase D